MSRRGEGQGWASSRQSHLTAEHWSVSGQGRSYNMNNTDKILNTFSFHSKVFILKLDLESCHLLKAFYIVSIGVRLLLIGHGDFML